ncbi:MAG: DUF4442 domain-containing protein [Saprospiraceae bacterium]|jgi:hypothetical protein|nr:DUF4442 domain-containing protein [Saprospiraceae bacterium]
MNKKQLQFIRIMNHRVLFWWTMLFKLPSLIFWGVKIKSLTMDSCSTTIPYHWRTQNPFKSIYFAALAGAAELSTGALCMLAIQGNQLVSMLVINLQAEYFKKANQKITFICDQGESIQQTISNLSEINPSNTITLVSNGYNEHHELVAQFKISWSFKLKSKLNTVSS